MKIGLSDSDDLYRATTLSERAARLEANATMLAPDGDIARARARLERWQQPPTFADASGFAFRLQAEGLTEPQLLSLLAEPAHALSRRFEAPPDWMDAIAAAYDDPDTLSGEGGTPDAETAQLGLLRLASPLIDRARQRLRIVIRETCRAEPSLPFDPETVDRLFLSALVTQMGPIVMRTLTLELNVARLQGRLTGETAEERYQSFVALLGQPEYAIGLLKEYPVMARQLAAAAQRWTERTAEFLQRLCAEWQALRDAFAPETEPGRLLEIESGGDAHRGGRSVLIARFESGLHLVYKPRALAVDVHFQELLAWLNERGAEPPFRTLTVLDRGEYGWVEYVVGEPCSDEAGMRRFYERQGGYLALLYALEATDFHFENLIAAGEDPVLLDLEALFHPRLWESDGTDASAIAWSSLSDSVLRIGLLPQRMPGAGKADAVDISGLGGGADQMTPYALPRWEAMGTDTMHLVRKPVPIPAGKHQPHLNGAAGRASEYADAIQSGFTHMYRLLWRLRPELLAESGPLERFVEDPVRVLLRNTQQYGMLLNESFHPDLCRDALDRDRWLDRLWRDVPLRPGLARVLPSELRDLHQDDIPMFTGRPGVRHLWDSRDAEIADFCVDSGLDLVRRRLQGFSEEDLARQVWIIQSSLLTLTDAPRDRARAARAAVPEGAHPVSPARREDLLELASAVGDRLVALALRGPQDATWIGVSLQGDRHWAFAPASLDLYDGLPGIILFLAHLGATTGVIRYTSTARAALNTVRSQIARSGDGLNTIGLFTGLGGLIYLFTHLSAIWEQPEMLQEAEALLPQLPARIDADAQFDVIAGSAGCLDSLLGLADVSGSRQAMDLARHCGDHLVRHACPQNTGVGWISMADNPPLTGFSHGVAGVAHALLELWSRTGDERYRATACAGLAYERSLFSTEAGNWVDLRQPDTDVILDQESGPHCVTAWCHGAPGIGLSRLYARRHLQDPCLLQEIETAVQTTLTSGLGIGHSLCHGDLGNIELVRTALEQMPAHFGGLSLDAPIVGIVESIRRNGWLCGNPIHIESPGLMTGIAGIGYGLLRLAAPETVPSVLAVEAPYAR